MLLLACSAGTAELIVQHPLCPLCLDYIPPWPTYRVLSWETVLQVPAPGPDQTRPDQARLDLTFG